LADQKANTLNKKLAEALAKKVKAEALLAEKKAAAAKAAEIKKKLEIEI
jgi:hypothetical protein